VKRTIAGLLTIGALAALAIWAPTSKHNIAALPVVHAQGGCSVATLSGSYGFNNPGFVTANHSVKGAEVPFAAVGVVTLDGAGNGSGTYTLSINGGISTGNTFSETYTVNPDCTGSTTVQGAPNSNFVILGSGEEIFGVETTPGFTGSFDAKKL
jgi:hypothetical protein